MDETKDLISVIITVLNGGRWIDNCMKSIIKQTAVQSQKQQELLCHHNQPQCSSSYNTKLQHSTAQTPFLSTIPGPSLSSTSTTVVDAFQALIVPDIEVCVFDDCSSDNSIRILQKWRAFFKKHFNIVMHIVKNKVRKPKGVGHGRNRAIAASKGNYLCFQDIDDEMLPDRIWLQYNVAKQFKNAIIGSKFVRIPENSTWRFTHWANSLQPEKLMLQIYTSNGPTVIMPTWFCHRQVYESIAGGFCETGHGCPEDLLFFYKHLDNQGVVKRVDEDLLKYCYHSEATTFTVLQQTIREIRLNHLIENVLRKPPWCKGFSIWNAGRQGKRFFRELPDELKRNVIAFCDVNKNKVNTFYKSYDADLQRITFSIPIVHFSEVQPPVVICMKLNLTNGDFENNLQSLQLTEGDDYILFT